MHATESLPNAVEPASYIAAHRRVKHPNVRRLRERAALVTQSLEVLSTAEVEFNWGLVGEGEHQQTVDELLAAGDDVVIEHDDSESFESDMAYLKGLRFAHDVLESRAASIFLADVRNHLPSMSDKLERALAEAIVVVRDLRALYGNLTAQGDDEELGVDVLPPMATENSGPSVSVDDLF